MKKSIAMILAVLMIVAMLPMSALAANDYTINSTTSTDDYYNLISKKDWEIAPGITESQIVLNNDAGSQRQMLFVMEADLNNEYVKVINSYNGMVPKYGDYKTGVMSEQAAFAEANGYGNVVGAMNTCLSWYTGYPADRVGEPLGFIMLDAETLFDPANCGYEYGKVGFPSVLVINKDFDEEGNPRPADIPKVEMPQITSAADLDGWEEQVIPTSSGYIVKDGVNQSNPSHTGGAPRSVVGIKADGTVVIMVNDGRQAPYSEGMSMYELAEVMLDLGCTYAVNCDGGGSTTWLSQRPGEELKVNNSPSDGAERPTTTGILFVTTAPADGTFARATISCEGAYYTPGSTIKFDAFGTDLVGTAAEIPDDVTWQLADPSMGTIKDGVFVSNGKLGTVTAQMLYNDKVVGEHSIEIVIPTEFSFSQAVMTVPFDKEVTIGLTATINGGLNDVVLKPEDVEFVTTNAALGTFNGFKFTSVSEEDAPADLTSTLTATFVHDTNLVATAALNLGKGSEVLFDFEDATDIDEWNIADVNGNDQGFYQNLSFATNENGEVHNGNGSMRVEMNPISANGISNGGYGQSDLFLDKGVVVENAKSIGFWAYIPDEYEHCWIRVLYWYDPDGDGKFDKKNTISVISQPEVYNKVDESGWRYFSVDVSAYSKVLIAGLDCKDRIAYTNGKCDANNFRFIEFMFPHTNTNDLWKTYGTINGLQTVYIDNITADYSDAVDDREAPIFGNVELLETEKTTVLEKYNTVTTTNNLVTVATTVKENTTKTNATGLNAVSAKAYVDGVEVPVTFSNGRMSINDVALANGVHRVKFEICDNMDNKSVVIRLIKVASSVDASTVQVVPADPTLNNLYGGSVYWMNVNANKIETIQSVKAVIDLNYGNHFELDNMVLADGFTASYTIDEENNTAVVNITRTGKNTQTGAVTLASLPIRVIYYDTDIKIEGYTAETYWNTYGFWPYDLKVDIDMGEITYVDGYDAGVIGAFSNEEFSVDTELQTGFSDVAFKTERGTAHVHVPVAINDKVATCTASGYTGRTYCDVCDSVVDWGTIVPTTGHTYKAVGNQLVCDCGDVYAENGLVVIDGTSYYVAAGKLIGGWIDIDGAWYYFDATTFNSVETYNNGYVTFKFEEDGKLISGEWHHTSKGSRYYYGPAYYTGRKGAARWYEIDGKNYCFPEDGYCYKGIRFVDDSQEPVYTWYNFGTDGAMIEKFDYTGPYAYAGRMYYIENGVSALGMYKYEGAYYYGAAGDHFAAIQNTTRHCYINRDLLPEGTYTFGADGKMVDNALYTVDNILYYFELGNISANVETFEIDGVAYNVDETGKVLYTGLYTDASGAEQNYVDGVVTKIIKNGLIGDYYYINDVKVPAYYGLVEWKGNYYYINDYGKIFKNGRKYLNKINGLTFPNGDAIPQTYFEFDADGKMIIKQGIVDDMYYVNGVAVKPFYGLVEWEGNFYYVNAEGTQAKIVKNQTKYENKTNGLTFADGTPVAVGYYEFDTDGKMIVKQGLIDDQYFVNGIALPAYYGLIEWEGNFYYINDYGRIVKNTRKYLNKINGLTFPNGDAIPQAYFEFDADGKMIIKQGIVDDMYYINGVAVKPFYGLVEWEGNFYYVNAEGTQAKIVKNQTKYVNKTNGLTFADGTPVTEGYYEFDANGKMLVKQGLVDDQYFVNGIALPAYYGLIEWEGNFYYINDYGRIVKNTRKYVNKTNGLNFADGTVIPNTYFYFDADGKMIID